MDGRRKGGGEEGREGGREGDRMEGGEDGRDYGYVPDEGIKRKTNTNK